VKNKSRFADTKNKEKHILAEQVILSCMLIYPERCLDGISKALNINDFVHIPNKIIYEIITQLHALNTPIDYFTVYMADDLHRISFDYILGLGDFIPTPEYWETYVNILKGKRDIDGQ
jgi:replicative DNA helicase